MRVLRVLEDDDAVSPVIGIILMVAITVILATTVGTFVLGLGSQGPEPAPETAWGFEYPTKPYSSGTDEVVIQLNAGGPVDSPTGVTVDGDRVDSSGDLDFAGAGITLPVSIGDPITVVETGGADSIQSGDDVFVIYRPDRPDIRAIIGSDEVP